MIWTLRTLVVLQLVTVLLLGLLVLRPVPVQSSVDLSGVEQAIKDFCTKVTNTPEPSGSFVVPVVTPCY